MSDDFTTKTQYSLEDIAREGRMVFLDVLSGSAKDDWQDVPPAKKERWLDAVEACIVPCEQEIEASWSDLGEACATRFYGNAPKPACGPAEPLLDLAWEAVARHACNLILAEDRQDLASISAFDWQAWAERRLSQPGVTPLLQEETVE